MKQVVIFGGVILTFIFRFGTKKQLEQVQMFFGKKNPREARLATGRTVWQFPRTTVWQRGRITQGRKQTVIFARNLRKLPIMPRFITGVIKLHSV